MLGHSVIFFVLLHLPTVAASRRRAIETWPPPKIPPSARRPRRNEGSSFVLTNFKIGNSGPEINPAGPAHTRARALTHSHTERKPLFGSGVLFLRKALRSLLFSLLSPSAFLSPLSSAVSTLRSTSSFPAKRGHVFSPINKSSRSRNTSAVVSATEIAWYGMEYLYCFCVIQT